jgi:hypothetical protein
MLVFNQTGIYRRNHRHSGEVATRCAALAVNGADCDKLAAARE